MRPQAAIAYMALFHAGMGLSILIGPHPLGVPDHAILYDLMPWGARAGLWIGLGIMAALASLRSARWGWVLLSIMPAQRLVGHAWSTWAYLIPGVPAGLPNAFTGVIVWGAMLLLICHLAGWPDLAEKQVATGE